MRFSKTVSRAKIKFNQDKKKILISLFALSMIAASTIAIVVPTAIYHPMPTPYQTFNLKKIGNFKNNSTYPEVFIQDDKDPSDHNVLRFMNAEPGSDAETLLEFTGWGVFGTKIEQDSYSDSIFDLNIELNTIPKTIIFNGVESQVKNIGFFASNVITSVTVPNFIEVIGKNAFNGQNNLNLTELDLSNAKKLVKISNNAFVNCNKLTGSLKIPASVTYIGENAFSSGAHFSKIGIDNLNQKFALASSASVGKAYLVIDKTIYSDLNYDYATKPIGGLACGEIKIPASVTSIGDLVFSLCSCLTGIDFSNATSLQTIGDNSFLSCINLASNLNFPTSLTSIGNYAFENCPKLTGELTLANVIKKIGNKAFFETNFSSVNFLQENPLSISAGVDVFAKPTGPNDKIIIYVPTSGIGLWQNMSNIDKILGIADINQIQSK